MYLLSKQSQQENWKMPIQVMPKVMDDSYDMRSPISSSFFRRVRICMFIGGTYPGLLKKNRILSILMMIYVGLFWIVWTGIVVIFIATIYINILESREITRMITYFLTIVAAFYPSFINSLLLPKTLRTLEELFKKYEDKHGFSPYFKKWTKRLKVIIVMIPIANILYPFMASMEQLNCDKHPSCEFPEPWRIVSQSTSIVAFTMAYPLFQTTFVVFNVVAYILLKEFGRVSQRFQKLLTIDLDKQEQEFKACSEQYEHLADLQSAASDFTQHFSLALFFLSLPLACSYMYAALIQEATGSDIIEMVFGAIFISTFLGVWLLTEANVSLKACEPLQYMWKLETDNFTQKGVQKVLMLISRLRGDSPGYSVYGLVTINMPTVLTVVGTLAAYVVVVIQFRPPTSPNCQVLMNSSQLIVP